MLGRFRRQAASWFRCLWSQLKDNFQQGKLPIFLVGGALAGLNWAVAPSFFVTVPADDCAYHLRFTDGTCNINESNIRAAGFTLITAVTLFASVLSDPKTLVDKVVERGIRLLGVASATGAGWFWMDAETFGHPWAYVGPMLILVGIGVYTIVGSGFFFAGMVMAVSLARLVVPAVMSAVIMCLKAVIWNPVKAIIERVIRLRP